MAAIVITFPSHRYLWCGLDPQGAFPRSGAMREKQMKNKILTILGSALVAAATVQFAAAAERQHTRKPNQLAAPASEQFQNPNAAWPSQQVQPDWSRYSGGYSAPAGR
jgi:hypothetical protein